MKFFSSCLLAAALFFLGQASLLAEDWMTTYGKVYRNVTVLKVEADAVTILHQDGGALVPLKLLPPDLQKRFNYDPLKAQAAADARAESDAADQLALELEREKIDSTLAEEKAESQAAIRAAKARHAHHDRMPAEPAVLEADKKVDGNVFNPPK